MTDQVTYLGHATVLIELAQHRILTDPVLTGRITFIRRQPGPAPNLTAQPDAVLISHGHQDHLHLASMKRVSGDVPIIAPRGLGRLIRRWGFKRVEELGVGETFALGATTITAVPADHSGFRPPWGPTAESIGFVVAGDGRRLYFAGDTDIYPGMSDIGRDGLDLALLPVWGWGPRLGPGHLDPERAADAVGLLRPSVAIPIHWGTLWPIAMRWRRQNLIEPPRRMAEAVAAHHPETRVVILAPGEAYSLPPHAGHRAQNR